jgi:hypothetical protein
MNLYSYFSRGVHWPRTNWPSHKRVLNLKRRVLIQWRLIFSRINGARKLLWEYHNYFCCIEISYLSGHSSRNTHINTVKSINLNFAVQSVDICIPGISVTVDTDIFRMVTVVYFPPKVTAIPYEWFVASALHRLKQYWTSTLIDHSKLRSLSRLIQRNPTDDRQRHCRYIIPFVITDSTPAKGRMKCFDSPCLVVFCCIYQSHPYFRLSYNKRYWM